VQAEAAPPSIAHVVEVGLLVAVQEIDALVDATEPVGALVIVTTGASGCTLHVVVLLSEPPEFEAVTVTEWEPTARFETLYGLVQGVGPPPSSAQVMLVGLLVAVKLTAAEVDVDEAGCVMVTTGACTGRTTVQLYGVIAARSVAFDT
jgi:xanthosine utilization system XapX-like protein